MSQEQPQAPSLGKGRFSRDIHGGDGDTVARLLNVSNNDVLDLSVSLNPNPPDVVGIAKSHLDSISKYPNSSQAREALAEALGVKSSSVILTNGGAEAIAIVAQYLSCGWVEEPEFSLYIRYLARIDESAPRFASNPNNPTGQLASEESRSEVWDEAFFQLASGKWSRKDYESGSIVLGSLTKLLACPGLRIGYIIVQDDKIAYELESRIPIWSINALACAIIPELIENLDLQQVKTCVDRHRSKLIEVLDEFDLPYIRSDANYICVQTPQFNLAQLSNIIEEPHYQALRAQLNPASGAQLNPASGALFRCLLAGQRVVVRDCTSFGMDDYVRVAVPNEDGLEKFRIALDKISSWRV